MPRPSLDNSLTRRAQVEFLELRGASAGGIAKELQADRRTIQRDLAWLASARAQRVDVGAARLRLLEAAAVIEVEAWRLHQKLPATDTNGRLGCLGKILASQERQAALLGTIELASVSAEVAELRERVAAITGVRAVR